MKTERPEKQDRWEPIPIDKLQKRLEGSLQMLRQAQATHKKRCEEAHSWLECHSAEKKAPQWIMDIVRRGDLEDSYVILSGHTFWEEHELREGLRSLYAFAHQACVDVCSREKGIAEYETGQRGLPTDLAVVHPANLARKDLMAYCASAIGFRNALVEIGKIRSADKSHISSLRKRCFELNAGPLIGLLRNSLFHARVVAPIPSAKMVGPGSNSKSRSSAMYIFEKQLLSLRDRHLAWCKSKRPGVTENAERDWAIALDYFDRVCGQEDWAGRVVRLSRLVGDHLHQMNICYRALLQLFSESVSNAERDFKRLLESASSQYAD